MYTKMDLVVLCQEGYVWSFGFFQGMHSLGINGEGKSWGSLENGH